jgi:hypothetical protein
LSAYQIYGEHREYVRGQMVKKTIGRVKTDVSLKSVQKMQRMYTDVMHIDIDTKMFLVLVSKPLNLMLQYKVEN